MSKFNKRRLVRARLLKLEHEKLGPPSVRNLVPEELDLVPEELDLVPD